MGRTEDLPRDQLWPYELRVLGHVAARPGSWVQEVCISHGADATSTMRTPPIDQAALHGLLAQLRDLGLHILSVTQSAFQCNESARGPQGEQK